MDSRIIAFFVTCGVYCLFITFKNTAIISKGFVNNNILKNKYELMLLIIATMLFFSVETTFLNPQQIDKFLNTLLLVFGIFIDAICPLE